MRTLFALFLVAALSTSLPMTAASSQQEQSSDDDNIVTILSHSLIQSGLGFTKVAGEVRNDSPNNTIQAVFINGKFYDSTGQLIHLAEGSVHNVRPGEKRPFSISIIDPSVTKSIANYTLSTEVGSLFGDMPAALKVGITKEGKRDRGVGSESLYQVIGNVTNSGNLTATLTYVEATFYDAAGRMVNFETTLPSPETIPPSESADFIIETPLMVDTRMGDYGNWSSTQTITSAKVKAKSTEYLSEMAAP